MKHDNCKDCVSKCEHAGKDREFIVGNGVSCKVTKKPIVTKADLIRAMNDHDLAVFLEHAMYNYSEPDWMTVLSWLQQPAEEET